MYMWFQDILLTEACNQPSTLKSGDFHGVEHYAPLDAPLSTPLSILGLIRHHYRFNKKRQNWSENMLMVGEIVPATRKYR